ncbi:hypothetical protein B0H13DRAFT_2041276 [Mycena leptocephala]|nr:hypothetical protein B0H13DRAFT_2041276 [Mycena leptocephala]
MPPRTRSAGRGRLLALGLPVNRSGLPSLPVEILDEIVSHLIDVPVPIFEVCILPCIYLERTQTLRALSETCQCLRSAFLARAWQHLEVCASRRIPGPHSYDMVNRLYWLGLWKNRIATEFARELVRQMEIVTVRNPALAFNVGTVTVVLSEKSAHTVFPEFFRCLSLLPNLHTIQIVRAPVSSDGRGDYRKRRDPFNQALSGYTFPSVRTLVLHSAAINMVGCCPNLNSLTFNSSFSILHLPLPRIAQDALKLNVIVSAPLSAGSVTLTNLIDLFPNLTEMPPINTLGLTPVMVKHLAKMKRLRKIDLVAAYYYELHPEPPSEMLELVAVAKDVLRGTSTPDRGPSKKFVTLKIGTAGVLHTYPLE